jgi:NADH-quinone oxidoreductase subunit A
MTQTTFLLAEALEPRTAWAPVALLLVIGLLFVTGTLLMSVIVGPKRTGPSKERTYESGMVPIGDTRRRFNVRFYLVAVVFLLFDVEIVFFYPWATLFPSVAASPDRMMAGLLLGEIILFAVILLVAYFYAWGKGVFRWD